MNSFIVEIRMPALDRSFDVRIPAQAKFSDIARLASEAFATLSNGEYLSTVDPTLYLQDTGEIMIADQLVSSSSIQNGTKLVLL